MTLTRRTHCQDHNGIVHVASRIRARGCMDAFTLCGRDMPISSYWDAGARDAPAVLVTCKRCLAEANPNVGKLVQGDMFDALERNRKDN